MDSPDTKTNLLKLNAKGKDIEKLYTEAGVRLPAECTLAMLIANVKSLIDRVAIDAAAMHTPMQAFRAVQLYRVADAILALHNVTGGDAYLRKITADLDFFKSERSPAKDIFWELELWWMIRRKLPTARLLDPPDIMLELDGGTMGVACKAVYSEKKVQSALSTGIKQVTGNCDAGVVAFNIDSLIPSGCVVREENRSALDRRLESIVDGFLRRHQRHIHRYMAQQRLAAVAVFISAVGDVYGWRVPFNTIRSGLVYVAGPRTPAVEHLLGQLRDIMVIDRGAQS